MGSSSTKVQSSSKDRAAYEIQVIPSKAVFGLNEDITGRVVLDMNKPFTRSGLLVVSLDGKEQFEYVPAGSKSHQVARNENKFLREREVLAQFDTIPVGRHTFNFNFTLGSSSSRKPPTVSLFQEIRGSGIIDIQCSYKVGVSIYDTTNRVDKVIKTEFPIFIQDTTQKQTRKNFVEMGQSQVLSCLGGLGQGGISSFMIKCPKDIYSDNETIKIHNKIDNMRCSQKISKVQLKLVRYIRLHTGNFQHGSGYDTLLTQVLAKKKYDGQLPRVKDRDFLREYTLDLDQIFEKEREGAMNQLAKQTDDDDASDLSNLSITPTSYGKTFMVHYAIQVSMKHPGFFSQSTSLEIDINIDLSSKDYLKYEQCLKKIQDHSNKFYNGP